LPLCGAEEVSLLNCVIPEVLPPLLMGSASASSRSVLEAAGIGSIGHGESFWQLLTEDTPVAPWLPKPCHANPVQLLSFLSVWKAGVVF